MSRNFRRPCFGSLLVFTEIIYVRKYSVYILFHGLGTKVYWDRLTTILGHDTLPVWFETSELEPLST